MLDRFVDGQLKAVAVFRIHHLVVFKGHIGTDAVFHSDDPTCRAGEIVVIMGFQTGKSLPVRADKSQHGRSQRPVRIIPFKVGFQQDTAVLIIFFRQFFLEL